jgi:hypothetical protein
MRSTRSVRQKRFEISNFKFEIRREQAGLSLVRILGIMHRSNNHFVIDGA